MKPVELGSTLHGLGRAHRRAIEALLAPHGIHAGQDAVLLLLWQQPGIRLSTLATQLGVERPTVTRMVQRLERAGLVERTRDPQDGRAWRVSPTPRSRLLEAGVRHAWRQVDERIIERLGVSDAELLGRLADGARRGLLAGGTPPSLE